MAPPPTFPTSYDPNHPNEAIVPLPDTPLLPLKSASTSYNLSYQAPLSLRGSGPGLIIFNPPKPTNNHVERAETLDPEPFFKWAEEGYGILLVDDLKKDKEAAKDALDEAIRELDGQEKITNKEKYAVFVYDQETLDAVLPSLESIQDRLCALVSYGIPIPTNNLRIASLSHVVLSSAPSAPLSSSTSNGNGNGNGHGAPNVDDPDKPSIVNDNLGPVEEVPSCPVPDPNFNPYSNAAQSFTYTHVNNALKLEEAVYAVLPSYGEKVYDAGIANLAHSRSLSFLKPKIGGPWFDLERIWDAHTWYEFVGRSVAQTMGTMVAEPYVNHVPTMIGGVGRKDLTVFYRDHFIFANPPDSALEVVSRTVGIDRIVDEFVFTCNHSTEWEWFLPGVPPTYKDLRVPFIAVVCIRGDRLFHEHIWWDQATALRQCGVLPDHVPFGNNQQLRLPVAGVETAAKLQNENLPSNEMFGSEWGVKNLN